MLMPVLAHPRADLRPANVTEAIRSLSIREGVINSSPLDALLCVDGTPKDGVAPGASQEPHTLGAQSSIAERAAIETDDSGLKLLESVTLFDDAEADVELSADQLRVCTCYIYPVHQLGHAEFHSILHAT